MFKSKSVQSFRSSYKLRERNVQHTRINNIKELANIYDFGEMLGQGVFGTVVEVKDKQTQKTWAAKIVDKQQAEKLSRGKIIEREIQILKIVSHPHIIYLDRIYESNQKIYLILEKCDLELAVVLKQKTVFSEQEARKVIQSLSSAIAYLHKYEIVHRDLKLENILTAPNPNDSSDPLFIKVTDFGLGIIKAGSKPGDMLKERCGTLTYMAPEIISRAAYTHQCDVWAMGVLTYALLFGQYPFFSTKDKDLKHLICSTEPSYSRFTVSPEAIHLLRKMLTKNPALRITAAEVEHHAWVRGEPMSHESDTENVLDMMRLWRSEMMVASTGDIKKSDECVELKRAESNTIEICHIDQALVSEIQTPPKRSSGLIKEQALPLAVAEVLAQSQEERVEKDSGSLLASKDGASASGQEVAGTHTDARVTPAALPTPLAATDADKITEMEKRAIFTTKNVTPRGKATVAKGRLLKTDAAKRKPSKGPLYR